MIFYTEDLLNSMKIRSFAPMAQTTFTDTDFILILNEELQLKLVSDIQGIREDFFLASQDSPLTVNISNYFIPGRAIGNALRAVTYVDSVGNESAPLNRVTVDRSYLFQGKGSVPNAYYILSDQIVLLPTPTVTQGKVRQYFSQRPNQLVATASCAKITAVSSALGVTTFTVDTDLTASLTTASFVDILRTTSPFMLWAQDLPVVAITSTTIQVTQTLVSDANAVVLPGVGDYICPQGRANIAQIPQEFHPMLAQMGAVRALASLGDLNKHQAAKAELQEVRKEGIKLIKNRVISSPEKVDSRGGVLGRIGSRYGLR